MIAAAPLTAPEGRPGVTFQEIAAWRRMSARYVAENPRWGRHPAWPAPIGKRGRSREYDPGAVEEFVQVHHSRERTPLEATRLYTVAEIAEAAHLEPDTVWSYISRDSWPEPDAVLPDGTKLWRGATVTRRLDGRRRYRATQKETTSTTRTVGN